MPDDPVTPPVIPPSAPLPWWVVPSLAYLIILIFAGALAASCFLGNDTLKTQMFSTAVALAVGAAGFYFGSSKSSQDKDATISHATGALATSVPTTAVSDDNPVLNPAPTPLEPPGPRT